MVNDDFRGSNVNSVKSTNRMVDHDKVEKRDEVAGGDFNEL